MLAMFDPSSRWGETARWCYVASDYRGCAKLFMKASNEYKGKYFAPCDCMMSRPIPIIPIAGKNVPLPLWRFQTASARNAIKKQVVVVSVAPHPVAAGAGVVAHGGGVAVLGKRVACQLLHHEGRCQKAYAGAGQGPF